MHTKQQATQLIIIGITGDLARRKLLPAIATIASAGELPANFQVIGISRRHMSNQEVLDATHGLSPTGRAFLKKHLTMQQMDLDNLADYKSLNASLKALAGKSNAQRLYYLSIPPQFAQPIVLRLGQSGLAKAPNTKLLLEKPFGTDLTSAQELITQTKQFFTEEQLYRIDHYLAKEMTQNIIAFRSGNPLFNHTWNNHFVEKIDIIASERIGIEGRAAFYEQTGALRDFIQSHLLQLAALTLMNVPKNGSSMQHARQEALEQIAIPQAIDLPTQVVRGQYDGYAAEVKNPGSQTETFVALTVFSHDPQWQGVPVRLISGKALDAKYTEIRVHYKLFGEQASNIVTLRLQPKEGIDVQMWVKKPGYTNQLERLPLHFTYGDHYSTLPEAYERVLLDAIRSDHTLFASSNEVLASWRILVPIQQHWQMSKEAPILYAPGTHFEDVLKM